MTKSPPRFAVSISTRPRIEVVPADDPVARPGTARAAAPALGLPRRALVGGQRRASADVSGRLLGRLLGLPVRLELLGRAVAGIRAVLGEQPRGGRRVALEALHLAIRRVRPDLLDPGHPRPLVPGDPQPVQAVEDVLLERLGAPGDVRVLEAQDERAAGMAGEQVVEQRRPRGADVEGAGRAGRDPDADGGHGPIVGGAAPSAAERGRDLVEQVRVGVAREHADERRRTQAEGRPAARTLEGQRVQRLAAGEDR